MDRPDPSQNAALNDRHSALAQKTALMDGLAVFTKESTLAAVQTALPLKQVFFP